MVILQSFFLLTLLTNVWSYSSGASKHGLKYFAEDAQPSWHDPELPKPHSLYDLHPVESVKKRARRRQLWMKKRRELSVPDEMTPLFPGYGTHFAYIFVGKPPQRQSVILDTGSRFTAFPCNGCKDCGVHTDNYFDLQNSTTAKVLNCPGGKDPTSSNTRRTLTDQPSTKDYCPVSQSYTEGSSWDGYKVTDIVYVGGTDSTVLPKATAYAIPFTFACLHTETGLFQKQLADGIMGMSNSNESLPNQLVAAGLTTTNLFALCFRTGGGILTLGGVDQRIHTKQHKTVYLQIDTGKSFEMGWYHVLLTDIVLVSTTNKKDGKNGKTPKSLAIGLDKSVYLSDKGTIVDSGTTDTYLPVSIQARFEEIFFAMTGVKYAAEDNIRLSPAQISALPNIVFVFESTTDSTGSTSGNTGNGSGNTGSTSGNTGSGSGNTGNSNGNTGNGNGNTGNGYGNTGNGYGNTGNGYGNTGSGNTGNGNTGNSNGNTGNSSGNTGNGNTGSGNGNTGNSNTGNGNGNTGSGNGNTGKHLTEIEMSVDNYLEAVSDASDMYVFRVLFSEKTGNAVLGSNFMTGYNVFFDAPGARIGMARSSCNYEEYNKGPGPAPSSTPGTPPGSTPPVDCATIGYRPYRPCTALCTDVLNPAYISGGVQMYIHPCTRAIQYHNCTEQCSYTTITSGRNPACPNKPWSDCTHACIQAQQVLQGEGSDTGNGDGTTDGTSGNGISGNTGNGNGNTGKSGNGVTGNGNGNTGNGKNGVTGNSNGNTGNGGNEVTGVGGIVRGRRLGAPGGGPALCDYHIRTMTCNTGDCPRHPGDYLVYIDMKVLQISPKVWSYVYTDFFLQAFTTMFKLKHNVELLHNAEKSASDYSSYTKLHFQIRLKVKDYQDNVLAIHSAAEKIVTRLRSPGFPAEFIGILQAIGARSEDTIPYDDTGKTDTGKPPSPPIPTPPAEVTGKPSGKSTGEVTGKSTSDTGKSTSVTGKSTNDNTGKSTGTSPSGDTGITSWYQSQARQSRFGWMSADDVVLMSAVALPIGETRNPDHTGTETSVDSGNYTDDPSTTSLWDYWLLGIALGCVVVVGVLLYLYAKLRQEYALLSKDKTSGARKSTLAMRKMWSSFTQKLQTTLIGVSSGVSSGVSGSAESSLSSLSKEQILREMELSRTSLMREMMSEDVGEDVGEEGYEEYYPTIKEAKRMSGSGSSGGSGGGRKQGQGEEDRGFFDEEEE